MPPLLAIALAILTRQVYLSLAVGIWIGYVITEGALVTGTAAAIDACVAVFADAGNTRVIIFSILVGSLIALVQSSGVYDTAHYRFTADLGIEKVERENGI